MRVSYLMENDVAVVRATDTLDRAAKLLRDRDCGSVVVIDDRRVPLAMVTDRDVCLAALATGRRLADIRVDAAMSPRVHTCRTSDTIEAAEQTMALHQVRRLPVVDETGRLQGLLALDYVAREARREADLLAPPVSCAAVGRTLGDIVRPRLIDEAERSMER
jgi:CBS domain-containing protein